MSDSRKWMRIAGLVLHVLIGALLIFSGSFKLLKPPPPEFLETLKKIGLDEQLKLIGAGELITGILLIVPWTASLGVLLTSAFWGGTIVAHMGMRGLVRDAGGVPGFDVGGSVLAAARDVQQLLEVEPSD